MSATADLPRFQQQQYRFAAHIRDPEQAAIPDAIEPRRMAIYSELFFNNVESTLASAFPVLRQLHDDEAWQALARAFFRDHHAVTPYLTQLPAEFLDYLSTRPAEPSMPWRDELAHYEWVELALGIAEEEPPAEVSDPSLLLQGQLELSPLAWSLSYRYPVHRIGPDYRPDEVQAEATHLLVYRDRDDEVGFIELNPVTARLLQLIAEGSGRSGEALLHQIAAELNHPNPETVVEGGETILRDLATRAVVTAKPIAKGATS